MSTTQMELAFSVMAAMMLMAATSTDAFTVFVPPDTPRVHHRSRISANAVSTPPTQSTTWVPSTTCLSSSAMLLADQNEAFSYKDHTSILLKVSYDGARYTGWSASNQAKEQSSNAQPYPPQLPTVPRPSRRKRRKGILPELRPGFVRPVEGELRRHLARIYGNVDPQQIVIEGCSCTDQGVHATGMIAQVYCLKKDVLRALEYENEHAVQESNITRSIPGKNMPYPLSSTDATYFESVPMNGDLSKMAFALNRMLLADVRIAGIAPCMVRRTDTSNTTALPFHPTHSTISTTYTCRISIGPLLDPTTSRMVWHVVSDDFCAEAVQTACAILQGRHDFSAFLGAPCETQDRRKRHDTPCTLDHVRIRTVPPISAATFPAGMPRTVTMEISVTGDRFLYKMVRLIAGALVAIGVGDLTPSDVERALECGTWDGNISDTTDDDESGEDDDGASINSKKPFACAPPNALVLTDVKFSENVQLHWQPIHN